jgi:hypothetical protein
LENRTYIYNFEELRLIDAIETCPNSRGLVALNPDPENTVLASPDVQKGYVRLNVYEPGGKSQRYFEKTRDCKLILRKMM